MLDIAGGVILGLVGFSILSAAAGMIAMAVTRAMIERRYGDRPKQPRQVRPLGW